MMPLTSPMNGQVEDGADRTLRDFFRAEMPHPWPQVRALESAWHSPVLKLKRSRFRAFGRLALAASILLIALSYLALAGSFRQEGGQGIGFQQNRLIGKGLSHGVTTPKRVPVPSGGEALLWEETIPGNPGERPTVIINLQDLKKGSPRR